IKCGECHVPVTNIRNGNHWNYSTATITFNGRATSNNHGNASVSRTGAIMQCSNTQCHTGKYNSGTTIAPFWNMTGLVKENGTTVGNCNKCHAMPPSGYAGHPAALNNSAAISTIYATCGGCHTNLSNTATNVSNVFVDKAIHINGTLDFVGSHAFPNPGSDHKGTAGLTPWGSCTGCHTNGSNSTYPVPAGTAPDCTGCHKRPANEPTYGLRPPSVTSSCYDCHGSGNTDGRPNGSAFPNYSGSHTKHV